MRTPTNRTRAFTIIELLVVVSIIALLVGILLPAIGRARDQAKLTVSQSNLKNMATAHAAYAAEWNDRQFTLVDDNARTYGLFNDWWEQYAEDHGSQGDWEDAGNHPPVYLGWGHNNGGAYLHFYYSTTRTANASLCLPIVMDWGSSSTNLEYFGAFRLPNAAQFNEYVSGRFYDKTFYAPKDTAPWRSAEPCFESPDEYCTEAIIDQSAGAIPAWSSYCMSPAAMFHPGVMGRDDPTDPLFNGYKNPFGTGDDYLPAAFRSPSFSQTLFPNLKTHMLEHHWLQNTVADCNPGFDGVYVNGCEPYYFNHGWESAPVTLFYDGHVESVGARAAMRADLRVRQQTNNPNWGLWSKDTGWGDLGYLGEYAYDQVETSFHILTTDGIRGRDIATD